MNVSLILFYRKKRKRLGVKKQQSQTERLMTGENTYYLEQESRNSTNPTGHYSYELVQKPTNQIQTNTTDHYSLESGPNSTNHMAASTKNQQYKLKEVQHSTNETDRSEDQSRHVLEASVQITPSKPKGNSQGTEPLIICQSQDKDKTHDGFTPLLCGDTDYDEIDISPPVSPSSDKSIVHKQNMDPTVLDSKNMKPFGSRFTTHTGKEETGDQQYHHSPTSQNLRVSLSKGDTPNKENNSGRHSVTGMTDNSVYETTDMQQEYDEILLVANPTEQDKQNYYAGQKHVSVGHNADHDTDHPPTPQNLCVSLSKGDTLNREKNSGRHSVTDMTDNSVYEPTVIPQECNEIWLAAQEEKQGSHSEQRPDASDNHDTDQDSHNLTPLNFCVSLSKGDTPNRENNHGRHSVMGMTDNSVYETTDTQQEYDEILVATNHTEQEKQIFSAEQTDVSVSQGTHHPPTPQNLCVSLSKGDTLDTVKNNERHSITDMTDNSVYEQSNMQQECNENLLSANPAKQGNYSAGQTDVPFDQDTEDYEDIYSPNQIRPSSVQLSKGLLSKWETKAGGMAKSPNNNDTITEIEELYNPQPVHLSNIEGKYKRSPDTFTKMNNKADKENTQADKSGASLVYEVESDYEGYNFDNLSATQKEGITHSPPCVMKI